MAARHHPNIEDSSLRMPSRALLLEQAPSESLPTQQLEVPSATSGSPVENLRIRGFEWLMNSDGTNPNPAAPCGRLPTGNGESFERLTADYQEWLKLCMQATQTGRLRAHRGPLKKDGNLPPRAIRVRRRINPRARRPRRKKGPNSTTTRRRCKPTPNPKPKE